MAMVVATTTGLAPSAVAADAQSQQWYLGPMQAERMWKVSTGKGIKVAVIDSGVNADTPSLKGQLLVDEVPAAVASRATEEYTGNGTTMAELIAGRGAGGGDRWTATLPAARWGTLSAKAAPGGGRLVLPTTDGHVVAVAAEDGRIAWERRDQAEKLSVEPVVRNGIAYVNGKTLTAVNVTDGTEIWSEPTTDMYRIPAEWGPVTVHGDSVYSVGGTGLERRRRTDAKQLWSSQAGADATRPVLFQGTGVWMIETAHKTVVRTLDEGEGYAVWTYELADADRNALAVGGNRAFVVNGAALHALPVF
ncbi:hypothetical protein SGLAM104S_10626 [Streptomyces glaucescens]